MEERAVTVLLPKSLRQYWAGDPQVDMTAKTLADVLAELGRRYPGLSSRIVDDTGRVRRHVHVFVNEDAVSQQAPDGVALEAGDVVRFLPAVSGG